jgi:hypothetical protein
VSVETLAVIDAASLTARGSDLAGVLG